VQDRQSRFVVACATGSLSEELIEQAVATTVQRTHRREFIGGVMAGMAMAAFWSGPTANLSPRANGGVPAWWFQRRSC